MLRPLLGSLDSLRHSIPAPGAELWGLTRGADGGLSLGTHRLADLLATHGSPLFVVDAEALRRNAAAFQQVPVGHALGCEVFYSYKTNPVPGVLSFLHELGVGAEVISPFELWLAGRLGVPPERIIYNGPGKTDASIRSAIELGIQLINCNHREEVLRVAAIARGLGRKPRIGIRVTTDDGWTGQFGTPVANEQALRLFADAMQDDAVEVVAVHAHRGGMLRSEAEVGAFVGHVLTFVAQLRAQLGLELEVLNFGGSLGLRTVTHLNHREQRLNQALFRDLPVPDYTAALDVRRYVELLVSLVEQSSARLGGRRPRIFVEPGRAMTGNAQLLLTSVMTVKDSDDLRFAILDAGVNIAESVRSEYHRVFALSERPAATLRVHRLVGPICTPGDTLYPAIRLPELAPEDALAIMDAGAYFVPFATSFSYPRPPIIMLDGEQITPLRRRETFEDLVHYDQR